LTVAVNQRAQAADLSMLGEPTGWWSGHVWLQNYVVQKIAKRHQIIDGKYNAGSYYRTWLDCTIYQQGGGFWAHMRKRQRRKASDDADVEHPIADDFWNAVGVCNERLLRSLRHRLPSRSRQRVHGHGEHGLKW
jgi:hypothetical protein